MSPVKLGCGHIQDVADSQQIGDEAFCKTCLNKRVIIADIDAQDLPTLDNDRPTARSYGCSYGCGNPYDYVFVSVADGTTEFPCMPCFIRLAVEIVQAVQTTEGAELVTAINDMGKLQAAPMTNSKTRKRGHEAPVNADDEALIEAFDSRITADELPEDFK